MPSDQLERALDARRRDAERRMGFATSEARQILASVRQQGRTRLTAIEAQRVDRLIAERDAARDELGGVERNLTALNAAIEDDADMTRRQAESYSTGVRTP